MAAFFELPDGRQVAALYGDYPRSAANIRNVMGVPSAEIANVSIQPFDLGEKDYSLAEDDSIDVLYKAKIEALMLQAQSYKAKMQPKPQPPVAPVISPPPPLKTRRAISLDETP